MKIVPYFLFICLLTAAMGQQGAQTSSGDALTVEIQRDHELHARSLRIVQAEQARAKQPLCPKAMTTLDINECYSAELGITDANYLKLVRTLGVLLRSGDRAKTTASPRAIPFDEAEAAWHNYQDLACNAAGDQYAGGTIRPSIEMDCRLTITRHHIDELWALYSDLGTR
jgi:uncharacterized protein YecT (DUF1311 family)